MLPGRIAMCLLAANARCTDHGMREKGFGSRYARYFHTVLNTNEPLNDLPTRCPILRRVPENW